MIAYILCRNMALLMRRLINIRAMENVYIVATKLGASNPDSGARAEPQREPHPYPISNAEI